MKLYARIWLAVVATIAAFTLVVAVFVREHTEHVREQFREQFRSQGMESGGRDGARAEPRPIELRNKQGEIVGYATRFSEPLDATALDAAAPDMPPRVRGFTIFLHPSTSSAKTQQMMEPFDLVLPNRPPRPPRPAAPWYFSPWGGVGMLGLMALAVALGVYPLARRLTKRLEALQRGVEQWGEGRLSVRVAVEGNDEVAYLAQKFNHAVEQVERLVSTHKTLLANASHELRSPLARIRMALALLEATPEGSPDKTPDATTREINRNIQELDDLIEEILLASRLDSPGASMGSTESCVLMGLAAEECARQQADLLVAEIAQGPFEMTGYPKLVRRLLRNLLENAQRHNDPTKGAVTLSLTAQLQHYEITVRDHGAGVPPAEAERIFEPFYRAKNASEQSGGVGLGLALVKSIAQRHGGSAACLPAQEGGGGCFVVRLAAQL